jgi:site-specific recombinase XerD
MSKKRCLKINTRINYNSVESVYKDFISYKDSIGICGKTKKEYMKVLNNFLKISKNELSVNSLQHDLIVYFSKYSKLSANTYNNNYKYLNSLFNWCVQQEILQYNPIKKLGLKKKKEIIKARNISEDNIKRLLSIIDLNTYAGFRNYIIILITLDTGIRPNELFNLKDYDINFNNNEINIRENVSKTRQPRILPISYQVSDLIKKLISLKPNEWKSVYIFNTVDGNQMSTETWTRTMKIYSNKIEYKITPYNFRHTFAIMFLKNGGNIFALQRIMGHSDLNMTKRYIALSQLDIQEQHMLASPLNMFIKRNTRITKLFK